MRRAICTVLALTLVLLQTAVAHAAVRADSDGDLVDDAIDLCVGVFDPFQLDVDGDGVGDLCDPDLGLGDFTATARSDAIVSADGGSVNGLDGDDHLYAVGDARLDGGSGWDVLVAGDGSVTLTGGPWCDTFAIDLAQGATVVITDFQPGTDRFAFAPIDGDPSDDDPPRYESSGEDHLVWTFTHGEARTTVEFENQAPDATFDLDMNPCVRICPDLVEIDAYADDFLASIVVGTLGDDLLFATDERPLVFGDTIGSWIGPGGSGDDVIDLSGVTAPVSAFVPLFWFAVGVGDAGANVECYSWGGDDVIIGTPEGDLLIGDAGNEVDDLSRGGDDLLDGRHG